MAKSKLKNYFLSLKFIGPNHQPRPIPIIVLGETLVAFQHIIYKCYLYKKGKLHSGARLTQAKRDDLALQLVKYNEKTETYNFMPFQTSPSKIKALKPIVRLAFQILDDYIKKSIVKFPKTLKQNLESMEYNQVKNITRQIGKNITEIKITSSVNSNRTITISKDTHEYIKTLKSIRHLGKPKKIKGLIIRLDQEEKWVDIKNVNNRRIHVFVKKKTDFKRIREADPTVVFTFTGKWRWKIGSDTKKRKRFVADTVTP